MAGLLADDGMEGQRVGDRGEQAQELTQLGDVVLDRGTDVVPELSRPLAGGEALDLRVTAGADPLEQVVPIEAAGFVSAERG